MHDTCAECGERFHRGPGYFLGSIYFNYGLTALIVTLGYVATMIATDWSESTRLVLFGLFALCFPLWYFRYARSLWLGFDHFFDPFDGELGKDAAAEKPPRDDSAVGTE